MEVAWWRLPGGGERDRTDDLLLAKQALSQLSYTPVQGSVISDQSSELLLRGRCLAGEHRR